MVPIHTLDTSEVYTVLTGSYEAGSYKVVLNDWTTEGAGKLTHNDHHFKVKITSQDKQELIIGPLYLLYGCESVNGFSRISYPDDFVFEFSTYLDDPIENVYEFKQPVMYRPWCAVTEVLIYGGDITALTPVGTQPTWFFNRN